LDDSFLPFGLLSVPDPTLQSDVALDPSWICSLLLVILFGLVLIGHCVLRMLPTNSAEPDAPKRTRKCKPQIVRGRQSIIRSHCLLTVLTLRVGHAMFQAASQADRARAERRSGTQLFADRVLRPQTRGRRDVLLQDFDTWTQAHLLCRQALYGVYSETINAVTSKRGTLRRILGLAWDLAFSWVVFGWQLGEVQNERTLSCLKTELLGSISSFLRFTTPKTRGRAARHQSARVDQSDVVEFLSVIFAGYQPDQLLWPMSSSTLRKRLNLLQTALGMPTARSHDSCPYDLGSFRPGGATDMLQQFEDSELVRRRGRWVSHKVLEIYLQEVSTATFHTRLSAESRSKVQRLSSSFTDIRLHSVSTSFGTTYLQSRGAICGAHRLGMVRLEDMELWHFAMIATKTSVAREYPTFGE